MSTSRVALTNLLAGPFIGELGWEVLYWSKIVQSHLEYFNYDSVDVICPRGHEGLYPFANSFHYIPKSLLPPNTSPILILLIIGIMDCLVIHRNTLTLWLHLGQVLEICVPKLSIRRYHI